MALEGSLRDFDLYSLFQMIKIQAKAGTLVLSREQEFVKVFFDNGEIVGCDSNQIQMEERVGAMLVRLGRITQDELRATVQMQRATLKRLGVILLESGKVSSDDLRHALFNQAMTIMLRAFRWKDGDYRFDSYLPEDLDREHFSSVPVDTLLMEAGRLQDEWPEVEKRLPDFSAVYRRTGKGESFVKFLESGASAIMEGEWAGQAPPKQLTHEQEMVLSYFLQPVSIQEILSISRFGELDTCRAVVDLLDMELLELAPLRPSMTLSAPIFQAPEAVFEEPKEVWTGPSTLLWLFTAILLILPILTYVPKYRGSINLGLASFTSADVLTTADLTTRARIPWILRLASPKDGGLKWEHMTGMSFGTNNPIADLSKEPDPMLAPTYQLKEPAPAPVPQAKPRGRR